MASRVSGARLRLNGWKCTVTPLPVITPAYHRVRNTGVIRSDRNPSRSSGSRTVLGFSVTVFRLAGSFQLGPHTRLAGSDRLSCAARSRAISSKLRPSPSSSASNPVKACHRFTATSTYAGAISMAWQARPVCSAAIIVVPEPRMDRKQPGPVTSCSQLGGACTRRAFVCRGRSRTSSSCRCPTPWFAYDRRPKPPSFSSPSSRPRSSRSQPAVQR